MTGYVAATYLRTRNKEPYMPIWLQDLVVYTFLVVSLWSLYNHDYPNYP
jgi:hypothetical protein